MKPVNYFLRSFLYGESLLFRTLADSDLSQNASLLQIPFPIAGDSPAPPS